MSELFKKIAQHEAEIKNPSFKTKVKKLGLKIMPYVSTALVWLFKRTKEALISYVILKLLNLL